MHISPLTSEHAAAAAGLFAEYPYKTPQRVVQRLDRDRINTFYASGLAQSLTAGQPAWLVRDDQGKPLALAGLARDAWHSQIYGMAMGKVQPWLNTIDPAAGPLLLNAVQEHAAAEGLAHLAVRLDGEDFPNLHLFESAGWRLVDVSMKFSRPFPMQSHPAHAEGYRTELATPADHDWIRAIGGATHGGTHFLNDPHLPVEGTRELFSQWLERCLTRLAYRVYVLRAPGQREGEGSGFVTYLRNTGFAGAVGRNPLILDFVLLDPRARCGGLGPWFIATSLAAENEAGFDYCELRTSAHNLAAVGCYEKLGFRCCATDFVLHRPFER